MHSVLLARCTYTGRIQSVYRRCCAHMLKNPTNAQRVASALHIYRAHTERIQSVYRAHMLKNPTNAQRVASARNEWSEHAPRIQRTASEWQRSRDCAARRACRHIF